MRKKLLLGSPRKLLEVEFEDFQTPQTTCRNPSKNYIISQCSNAPTHNDDNFHEKGDS
jgi:hypothetical protein